MEVLVLGTEWILTQPQIPLFHGNIERKQVDENPLDGKNSEDDESDYDSHEEELYIKQSDSEMGNPQQVLPATFDTVLLQLDSIKL